MSKYIPNIAGFSDFMQFHADGKPFFIVGGSLVSGFDLLVPIETKYNFEEGAQEEIEKAIKENLYFFNIEKSSSFYWPNTNMFSCPNEIKNVHGYIFYLKKYYQNLFK